VLIVMMYSLYKGLNREYAMTKAEDTKADLSAYESRLKDVIAKRGKSIDKTEK